MGHPAYQKTEYTIELDEDDLELCDSGVRPASRAALRQTLPDEMARGKELARFSVGEAAARLPYGHGGAIEIGLVESDDGRCPAPRRMLIQVWPRIEREGRYIAGREARFLLGPARRGGLFDHIATAHVVLVKIHEDRLLGAFELDLDRALLHGTFCARLLGR
jgi:hypothetical protein